MSGEFGVGAGEVDAREAAHGAVPAVAPDQPPGAHGAGGSADEHAVAGVFERGDLHSATHRYAESRDMVGEQLFQLTLRHQPRSVGRGVRGEVGIGPVHEVGVEDHPREVPGEPRVGRSPALTGCPVVDHAGERSHPLEHLSLHLFGGRQQAAAVECLGRRHVDRLRLHRLVRLGPSLEYLHRRPGERQLRGEHEAHRPGADHGHVHILVHIHVHEQCSIYERCSCQVIVVG
uniref:Uncharacterized protein n=1 Tax=Streptomyces avermitilis TaxID=33903 RepID=A0A499VPT4_STRAX|nr:hypothetical protein SAVMC3_09660 [Streptomyces avermitilis]